MNNHIAITYFTDNGKKLYEHLNNEFELELKGSDMTLADWTKSCFDRDIPMIFIGATGIAVRTIAPFLTSKLTDPAVIVIDELGRYIIPLVSGHLGGANELAAKLEAITGGVAVITTATDINDSFSPDLFAKENNLSIEDKDSIKTVSSRALENKAVTISIKDYPPKEKVDIIVSNMKADADRGSMFLSPKAYSIGIGCRKNAEFEAIEREFTIALRKLNINSCDIACIASIDIKENEPGLKKLSQKYRIPFITFDVDLLNKAEGEFTASDYVREQVGVDNVCERAAVLGAGIGAKLVLKKRANNGVTVAVAKRYLGMEQD